MRCRDDHAVKLEPYRGECLICRRPVAEADREEEDQVGRRDIEGAGPPALRSEAP